MTGNLGEEQGAIWLGAGVPHRLGNQLFSLPPGEEATDGASSPRVRV